ncbi:hypothetical protein WJX72_009221 [[Myrmecia] bisecta]|uniref:ATPase AAA-type core domain-containing protein n=1 Tax=[Myrmecia] bisecta TaxID=41462 RepID=A0AAW1PXJ4_9CHLO
MHSFTLDQDLDESASPPGRAVRNRSVTPSQNPQDVRPAESPSAANPFADLHPLFAASRKRNWQGLVKSKAQAAVPAAVSLVLPPAPPLPPLHVTQASTPAQVAACTLKPAAPAANCASLLAQLAHQLPAAASKTQPGAQPAASSFAGNLHALQQDLLALREATASSALASVSGQPDGKADEGQWLWTEKYRPTAAKQVCGGAADAAGLLRDWLQRWRRNIMQADCSMLDAHGLPAMRSCPMSSDSDSDADFQVPLGTNEDRCAASGGSVAWLHGPVGCGKSAAVFAAAQEAGFQLLEVNSSCERSGASLTRLIGEATQSARLVRNMDVSEAAPRQAVLTALVFEEIDSLSDDNKGFVSALANMAAGSKIPIVLVSNAADLSTLLCPLVGLEVALGRPPGPALRRLLALICSAEGSPLPLSVIDAIVLESQGDIRRAVLAAQLHSQSWHRVARLVPAGQDLGLASYSAVPSLGSSEQVASPPGATCLARQPLPHLSACLETLSAWDLLLGLHLHERSRSTVLQLDLDGSYGARAVVWEAWRESAVRLTPSIGEMGGHISLRKPVLKAEDMLRSALPATTSAVLTRGAVNALDRLACLMVMAQLENDRRQNEAVARPGRRSRRCFHHYLESSMYGLPSSFVDRLQASALLRAVGSVQPLE